MYSPPDLVIFEAVEGTLYILQKVTITLFQILFVAAAYAKTNGISRACEAAYRHALAILAVATARRQRIAPFNLHRASLPVAVAIFYNVY